MIDMIIETIGASAGLLGAIIAIVLSLLNGFFTFIMSMLAASGFGIILSGLGLVINTVIVGILPFLSFIRDAALLVFILPDGALWLITFIAFFVLNIWYGLGVVINAIWLILLFVVILLTNWILALLGLVPILGEATGLMGIVIGIELLIATLFKIFSQMLPNLLLTLILALSGTFNVSTTPNSARYFLTASVIEAIPLFVWQFSFSVDFIGGLIRMVSFGTMTWLGGLFGVFGWLFGFIFQIASLAALLVIQTIPWIICQIVVFILLILGGGHQAYVFLRRLITIV